MIFDILHIYILYAFIICIVTPSDWRPTSIIGRTLKFFDFIGNFIRWYHKSRFKRGIIGLILPDKKQ